MRRHPGLRYADRALRRRGRPRRFCLDLGAILSSEDFWLFVLVVAFVAVVWIQAIRLGG